MRVPLATIGALLISVSHAALAQEQNLPQGEAPQAERRCEPRAGELPMQAQMTEDGLAAQLPEAPLAGQTREMTAEELIAQLPEAPLADMPEAEKRQPEAMKAEMQQDQPVQTEMPRDPQWAAVNERNLGTTVDIPRAVLSTPDGYAHKRAGRRYKSPDGRAKVAIWTQRNTRYDTPASYLHRTFNVPRATVDYERFTSDFAVISGLFGTRVYYIRCNLSPRSGSFHCFDLAYPVLEKGAWDGVVARMSRSLRPHDD
jgi:hypothetical protein